MGKYFFTGLFLLAFSFPLLSQPGLSFYFNKQIVFDKNIPTPKQILGYQVGEWHISHDKLVEYVKVVASTSDRVKLKITGHTHEQRPILLLTITSPSNQTQIDNIKKEHSRLVNPDLSQGLTLADMPAVVWLGHSIHGNEASGSNAAMLILYYLAAAQGDEIEQLLDKTIVLLDPSYNPDGLNRFASWANSHKSKVLDAESSSLEHNEAWPGGRTNHYWFDLNRDWLPVQQPESRARIKEFYEWRPNILTDQHEMGTNSTYFFQPGIPSRNNPNTTNGTIELTEKIAQFHAEAFDAIGSLYYSEESFDDYYPGKGSTFPDLNGSIGILFEQASARGHLQESENGLLSFPFAIRNHVTTSLSTLRAAGELRVELLQHQRQFYKNAHQLASKDPVRGYVFSAGEDFYKVQEFIDLLVNHSIRVNKIDKSYKNFSAQNSYVVSTDQLQYPMIKTIFEKRTSFKDSLFYDVSAWTMPLAFGLRYEELSGKQWEKISVGGRVNEVDTSPDLVAQADYGYLLSWENYLAPAALSLLQKAGLKTKVANHNFEYDGINYKPGTIFIPVQNQKSNPSKIFETVLQVSKKYNSQIVAVGTGNTKGVRMGSPTFSSLAKRKILVVAGQGISPYEVGEVWHLLDQRMGIPMSLVSIEQLNKIKLSEYNTIVMVNGSYDKLDGAKLKTWLTDGGVIVATKKAGKWLADKKISSAKYIEVKADSTIQRPYNLLDRYKGAQVIGGAIFKTKADITHPLLYGYSSASVSVFRNSTLMIERSKNAYANPLMYAKSPLMSGYISSQNLEKLKGTAAVQVDALGKGRVITFTDNPNFRAFWYGTNRLFLNAIFFGSEIRTK